MDIIGRKRERHILTRCEQSNRPEFVAVYGRRRVGKTYLITEHFNNKFAFSMTGISNGNTIIQLGEFRKALESYYKGDFPVPKDWHDAFHLLEGQIAMDPTLGKKVIFIDEMPWLDTHKSGFLSALEHFWNAFASRRSDIMLIVCGSAASWMIKNLIDNYGGLHNRVTERMVVEPFLLGECESFYASRGVVFNRQQIAEAYMIFGGIPFYMASMDKMFGLSRNIDLLLFEKNAKLDNEFNRLYHSLFRHCDNHIRIVEELAKTSGGYTRQELSEKAGMTDGGGLTKVLAELESCGLIGRNKSIIKKNKDIYKLTDFYSLFYYRYLKNRKENDPRFWTNYLTEPSHQVWCGYAFERLCMAHMEQIKRKLGISGVITNVYTFRSLKLKSGAQIDIVIDRRDSTVNLCECKYSSRAYTLTERDADDLDRRRGVFLQETGTKKSIHMTMITANGLSHNAYCNDIQAEITLDDLFDIP